MSPYTVGDIVQNEERVNIKDAKAVRELLRKAVLQVTKWDDVKFHDKDNLFVQGMDSLQALQLIRHLRKALNKPTLLVTILYTNPSLAQLSESIVDICDQDSNLEVANATHCGREIEESLQHYYQLVDKTSIAQEPTIDSFPAGENIVVLTGSTGSLGSYILGTLMQTASVSHIYCLDRKSDSHSRHMKKNLETHKSMDFPASKVTFLKSEVSELDLGLDDEVYKHIHDSATVVIHSAWPVNFNISLDTFKPQMDGIVNILSFVSTIPQNVSLLFISSISSILGLKSTTVPEKIIDDASAPLPMGYAESKFTSERILDHAAKQKLSTVDIKIARMGQIAGPAYTSGVWNKSEWMPSLVVTSFHMGFIPENLDSDQMKLDWVPIDILSSSVVDIAFNNDRQAIDPGARVFHLLNQSPTTWGTLLPIILKTLNASRPEAHPAVTPIPYTSWLQRLRETARETALSDTMELTEILAKYPAIKLLDFFETLPETAWSEKDVSEALRASPHLANLRGIEWAWMEKWVKGWI